MQVQLCAFLTQPTIAVSTDTLEFDTLQCGMCQVMAHITTNTSWGRHISLVVPEYIDIPYPYLQLKSDCALPGGVELTPSFGDEQKALVMLREGVVVARKDAFSGL